MYFVVPCRARTDLSSRVFMLRLLRCKNLNETAWSRHTNALVKQLRLNQTCLTCFALTIRSVEIDVAAGLWRGGGEVDDGHPRRGLDDQRILRRVPVVVGRVGTRLIVE